MPQAIESEFTWEEEVKNRVEIWRQQLGGLMEKPDVENLQSLQSLKAAVDVQVALADLKIKARTADWAKTLLWTSLLLPFIGAIIGAIVGAMFKTPTH